MSMPDDSSSELMRARVQQLASVGAPTEDIRQLLGYAPNGQLLSADAFKTLYAAELALGNAHANIEVSKALYEQASNGKHTTTTLAWAKQRLGWRETPEEIPNDQQLAHSAAALAALQQLLDQLASTKASGTTGAAELAHGRAGQSATARD
jgi:hypothetical protein